MHHSERIVNTDCLECFLSTGVLGENAPISLILFYSHLCIWRGTGYILSSGELRNSHSNHLGQLDGSDEEP